jgi:outer membrane immunogenic protein
MGVIDPSNSGNVGALSTLVQSDIQGSVRGRAGYAFGRLLTFATGGVALGDFSCQSHFGTLDSTHDQFGNVLMQLFSYAAKGLQSTTRVGWTVGGGVERAVNNN